MDSNWTSSEFIEWYSFRVYTGLFNLLGTLSQDSYRMATKRIQENARKCDL